MADTEEPSRSPSIAAALERSHATPVAHPHRLGLFLFAAALAVCLLERLRWDGGTPISAELVVSEPGAALAFRAFALRCARADAGGEPQSA